MNSGRNLSGHRTIMMLIFAGLLVLAGCGSDDDAEPTATPEPEEPATEAPDRETRGIPLGEPVPAPDFELVDHNGDPFRLSDHRGRVTAVFFGYTHCPDICPLTLMHMQDAAHELGDDAEDALFLFISVDPEQDSPEQLAKYVERADAEIFGLTGDRETLETVWDAYDITVEIEPRDDGSYLVSHSAQIWLINQEGEAELILPPTADGEDMAHDIRWLLDRST